MQAAEARQPRMDPSFQGWFGARAPVVCKANNCLGLRQLFSAVTSERQNTSNRKQTHEKQTNGTKV